MAMSKRSELLTMSVHVYIDDQCAKCLANLPIVRELNFTKSSRFFGIRYLPYFHD